MAGDIENDMKWLRRYLAVVFKKPRSARLPWRDFIVAGDDPTGYLCDFAEGWWRQAILLGGVRPFFLLVMRLWVTGPLQ